MPTTNDKFIGTVGGAATTGTILVAKKYVLAGVITGWFGIGAVAAGIVVGAGYLSLKKW